MPSPLTAPVHGDDGTVPGEDAATLVVVLLVLVPAALLPLLVWYRDLDAAAVILSVLHVLTCCAGAAVAVYRGLRPCLLIASVFPYCWLAMPAVYQISQTEAAWGDPGVTLDSTATLTALAILAVGQAAMLIAYALVGPHSGARPRARLGDSGRARLVLCCGALLLACVALLPLVVSAAGGVGAFFTSRENLNESLEGGASENASPLGALIKIVPAALASVAFLLSVHLYRARRGHADVGARAAVLVGIASLGLLALVANPLSSSRFIFLVSFGPLALVLLRPYRRRAALAWLAGCVFAFLLAYPLADLFRRSSSSVASPTALLASKDFDGFQQAINTVTYVQAEGISWGSHLISGLFFFVPRSIWSSKELPASLTIAEERGYTFTNLSLPFPAEAYLNGGWVGVLAIMGALGLLLAVLDRAWREGSHWALVAGFAAMAQVGLWRGPFGSLVPVFGFAAALLVFALVFSHRRQPAGGPAEERSERPPATGGPPGTT